MKSASQLREEIHQSREIMDSIIATSEAENRDLTNLEAAKCETLVSQITGMNTQLDAAVAVEKDMMARAEPRMRAAIDERRAENGLGPIGGGSSPTMRVDSRGNRYALLKKSDKATDVYRPPCENAAGHFIVAKIFGQSRSTPQAVRMAMSTNDNSAGGFSVPNPLSGQIIDLVRAKSVLIRAGVQTAVLESGSLMIPVLETDTTNTTKAENQAFGSSQIVLGGRQANLRTAGCVVTLSRELAEDSADLLAQQLETFMANSLAAQVDAWGLTGVAPNPLGLLSRFDLEGSSKIESTGSVGAIDWTDLITAATAVRDENYEPNAAIVSPSVYSDLFSIETGDGTNAARGWLDVPPGLKNVEWLQTTNMPDTKAIIGQFDQYLFCMRAAPLVEVSTSAGDAFQNHQVLVKISQRIDFIPLRTEAFYGLTGIS